MTGEDLRSREYQSLVTRLWPLIVSGKVQDRWARTFTYLCRAREDAQMPQRRMLDGRSGLGRRDVMATGSRPLKRRRPGMAGTRQAESRSRGDCKRSHSGLALGIGTCAKVP
jgi:hypothetical protein